MSESGTAMEPPPGNDIRPVVATGGSGRWEVLLFIPLLLIGGIWLFNTLTDARLSSEQPGIINPAGPSSATITAPPPLTLPDRFAEAAPVAPAPEPTPALPLAAPQPAIAAPSPVRSFEPPAFVPSPLREFPAPPIRAVPLPEPTPRVVYDNTAEGAGATTGVRNGERVQAGRLRNPSMTVPQGTVIPAVLETALDSTRPGGARALVQRDVSSFDGTRVLIPRGSRIYGEYEADLRAGQRRALVRWQRLVRPDGVTMQLDSPSADPLGRAGVRGKVDSNFFERFGGAILQTALDVGAGLAVNRASDNVIVALPGSSQTLGAEGGRQVARALKVKQGASVSVFVARDLDFSSVER